MTLKLYCDLLSQPSRALYILLKASNVQFEYCPVALRKGEQKSASFKEIHRFQKVPALDDNGFKVIESVAILRYLAREKQLPDFWYPKDGKEQTRVDEYLEWQHNNTRIACGMYFSIKFLEPAITGKPPSEARVAAQKKEMETCLNLIEKEWLGNCNYLANNKLSAADLWAVNEIEQTRIVGYNPTEGRPILKAWLDRIRKDTNPHFDEAFVYLNKLAAKLNKSNL